MESRRPKVLVIGAGFGGLYAARELAGKNIDVTVIDRHNFHTFTPLLYQVATCGLDPSDIAYPVRGIFRDDRNVSFRLGKATHIDHEKRIVTVSHEDEIHEESYDYLVIAVGTVTNFFGNPELEQNAFGLKDVPEAVTLRNHILKLFERAAWEEDPAEQRALTTMVVVGGGPTGIETAGALYELYSYVLKKEYGHLQHMKPAVILLEALSELLLMYPPHLRQAAKKQLESLGVEVMLNAKVEHFRDGRVELSDGRTIPSYTLIWGAGVKGASLVETLDVELERGGRIPVKPSLEVIGRDRVYAVGDIAHLIDPKSGKPYPQVIPVANQQGPLAAKNVLRAIASQPQEDFKYHDRGLMATIGRSRAVAWPYYAVQLTGWFAWVTWLVLHLFWLMGFRNRLSVMLNWTWNYLTFDRSVRIIVNETRSEHKNERQKELSPQ